MATRGSNISIAPEEQSKNNPTFATTCNGSESTMLFLTDVLSDGTEISLVQTFEEDGEVAGRCDEENFPFSFRINDEDECRYNTFEHAWEDFGRCVRCTTLEELYKVARG